MRAPALPGGGSLALLARGCALRLPIASEERVVMLSGVVVGGVLGGRPGCGASVTVEDVGIAAMDIAPPPPAPRMEPGLRDGPDLDFCLVFVDHRVSSVRYGVALLASVSGTPGWSAKAQLPREGLWLTA